MSQKPVPQKPTAKSKILDIHPYVPGESKGGTEKVIKLASNESPLGPSPKVAEAIKGILDTLGRYPDGSSIELRKQIGETHGLDFHKVVCGNGSEQLISYLTQIYTGPEEEVIQSEFGFIAYKIATLAAGADIVFAKEKNYTTDVDAILAAVTDKTRLVFLANPNNPTGTWIPASEVKRLRDNLPDHILLALDAAYAEYVEEVDFEAGKALVDEAIASGKDNVCMLRTFSKIYGLAALRIGWCYGPDSVIDALNRIRGAFNLSTVAQVAGVAALKDQEYIDGIRELNNTELPRVSKALTGMGLEVLSSIGNFVLVKFPGGHSQAFEVFLNLKKRGIILRPTVGYGLNDFLRITIGCAHENDPMLEAMAEELGDS